MADFILGVQIPLRFPIIYDLQKEIGSLIAWFNIVFTLDGHSCENFFVLSLACSSYRAFSSMTQNWRSNKN